MFEFSKIALEDTVSPPIYSCELGKRKSHLCVRVVCCTSHEGMAGVTVHLGARSEADALFSMHGKQYRSVAKSASNEDGWANFPDASEQAGAELAIWIDAVDYAPVEPEEAPDEVEEKSEGAAAIPLIMCTVELSVQSHTVLIATVRSQTPRIPADFDASVSALIQATRGIRLLVDHGPNFGNQSASLALIQNVRRLGYVGPIQVLVDTHTHVEVWKLRLRFSIFFTEKEFESFRDPSVEGESLAQKYFLAIETKLLTAFAESKITDSEEGVTGRRISLRSDSILTLEDGADLRLARHFQDLPFAYTVSESTWDVELEESDLKGLNGVDITYAGDLKLIVDLELNVFEEDSNATKLRKLDPDYDAAQTYPGVTWLTQDGDGTLPCFDGASVEGDPSILGMMAGGEWSEAIVCGYRAEKTKTYSLIALQPLLWTPERRFLVLPDKGGQALCLPRGAAYIIDAETDVAPLALFEKQAGPTAAAALINILEARASCEFMVAYGIHQAHDSSVDVVLGNVLAALSLAIAAKRLRKTIVLVLCKAGCDLHFVCDKAQMVQLDADLGNRIDALAEDAILVVRSTPVPQRTFKILAQSANLPFVLEGANTSNLLQMLGKPYLSVSCKSTPYVTVRGNTGDRLLQELTSNLNLTGDEGQGVRTEKLAEYFVASMDAAMVFDGYFPKLKAHITGSEQDQLKWALYRTQKAFENRPAPSSEQCLACK